MSWYMCHYIVKFLGYYLVIFYLVNLFQVKCLGHVDIEPAYYNAMFRTWEFITEHVDSKDELVKHFPWRFFFDYGVSLPTPSIRETCSEHATTSLLLETKVLFLKL